MSDTLHGSFFFFKGAGGSCSRRGLSVGTKNTEKQSQPITFLALSKSHPGFDGVAAEDADLAAVMVAARRPDAHRGDVVVGSRHLSTPEEPGGVSGGSSVGLWPWR